VPAIVIEKNGIIASFNRSGFLTKRHRWPIFGLVLILGVCSALLVAVAFLFGSAAGYVEYVFDAFITAFTAVTVAVTYYYLRADKEGVAVDEIAKVFD